MKSLGLALCVFSCGVCGAYAGTNIANIPQRETIGVVSSFVSDKQETLFVIDSVKSELDELLQAYYRCNLIAERRPLREKQTAYCGEIQEGIKRRFLTENEVSKMSVVPFKEGYQIELRGYQRFKQWERDNPNKVEDIKRQQKLRLGLNE